MRGRYGQMPRLLNHSGKAERGFAYRSAWKEQSLAPRLPIIHPVLHTGSAGFPDERS